MSDAREPAASGAGGEERGERAEKRTDDAVNERLGERAERRAGEPPAAAQAEARTGRVQRTTGETDVLVELDLEGVGSVDVGTGVPFFDHMLAQLGKHGGLGLTVRTKGDLEVDAHHTVEDTSIALGEALREALGVATGIRRFGDATVPLDETLAEVAVDLSGRPYLVHEEPPMPPLIGSYDTTLTRHIFEALTAHARICLHVRVPYGRNPHHIVEAQFKAVARALRDAVAYDIRAGGVPSTKGSL